MTLRQKLITSLKERIPVEVNNFSSVKIIRNYDPEEMIDIAIPFVYQYTRPSRFAAACTLLVELCTAIGHPIMKRYGTPKNSALAARVGAFVLWSFEEHGLITHRMSNSGRSKNGSYIVEMLDEKAITELWEGLAVEKTEKLPYEKPVPPWECGWKMGHKMIKTGDIDLLKSLHPSKHPMLFKTLNTSEQVGWRINKDVLSLVMWALNNRTDAFSDIWEQTDKQAKASKAREARTIYSMASRFVDKTFYHMYYYDFR